MSSNFWGGTNHNADTIKIIPAYITAVVTSIFIVMLVSWPKPDYAILGFLLPIWIIGSLLTTRIFHDEFTHSFFHLSKGDKWAFYFIVLLAAVAAPIFAFIFSCVKISCQGTVFRR